MSGALVLQRGPLTQQPQYPAPIDRGNPLAAGLAGYWTPNTGATTPVGAATVLATPAGVGFQSSATTYWQASAVSIVSQSPTWTILSLVVGVLPSTSTNGFAFYSERPNGNQILKLGAAFSNTNTASLVVRDANATALVNIQGTIDVRTTAGPRVIVGTRRGTTDFRIYVNGRADGSSSVNPGPTFGATNATIGYDTQDSTSALGTNGALPLVLVWTRALSDAEIAQISANPWQLFQSPRRRLWLAVNNSGTGAALSGTAFAVASATGGLTTSIPLAASATVVASASGALSTQIALVGAAAGQATASGSLSTQIKLTGSAGAAAAASGALSTQIALAGAAAGATSAAGALSTQIALSGTAAASSSASGALTAGTGLSGSASASCSASGSLTTSIALAGSASCSSSASGTLSTTPVGAALSGAAAAASGASGSLTSAIVLAGAAAAQASASGSLAGQAATLSGAASTMSTATGSLSTQIVVAGAAQAVASAVGSLTTAIRLAGVAACSSSAGGALSAGLLPPEPNPHRMIVVQRRLRHFVARRRVRHFEVGR